MKNGVKICMLMTLTAFAHAASADDACFGAPKTRPGLFRVLCTVMIPAVSEKATEYEFDVTPPGPDGMPVKETDELAAMPFEVPRKDGQTDVYSFQIYNLTGACLRSPERQLSIMMSYSPPFCNPPTLDGKPQQCDGIENPHPAGGFGEVVPKDGVTLQVTGKNSQLSFACNGIFTEYK